MSEENQPTQVVPLERTVDVVTKILEKTSKSFEKSASVSLMTIGYLFFALPFAVNLLSGFIEEVEPFETGAYVASIIGAVVLLVLGAGIRVYQWRVNLIEAAKVTESAAKVVEKSLEMFDKSLEMQKQAMQEKTQLPL